MTEPSKRTFTSYTQVIHIIHHIHKVLNNPIHTYNNEHLLNFVHMETDLKKLWDDVLVEIELNTSKANFNTWFRDTFIYKEDDGLVQLSVPNAFVKEWLYNKHHSYILKLLRQNTPSIRSLDYIINKKPRKDSQQSSTQTKLSSTTELPLADYYINKKDNLNPRYTFDTFVVGPFNELAYAAAQAVVKKPGIVYNPLFVYGNTGLGKTHLMQAIGNKIKELSDNKSVYYVTSEQFTIDYVNAVQNNNTTRFKEKYRKYDVLFMDDIQFLSNKEKTQEELFHLFNYLYDNNKQIIFTSDKHPNFIPNLEDRLKSRFVAGMIIDVPTPDYESRVAVLKTKAAANSFTIQPEILDYLATNLSGNIRELEGALNAVICQTQLKNTELKLSEVKNLVKNNRQPDKNISIKDVVRTIADFYNIDEESIYQKTRRKEVIKPRQLTMFILREDLQISYPSIGQKLGGRDHTTVIHSCEKIRKNINTDTTLLREIEQIRSML